MNRVIFILFILFFSINITSKEKHLNIIEVAEGVFVHQGEHLHVDESYQGDIANIGFIIGADSVAVIDSGGSPSIGRALKESIREKTSLPIKYVINTHHHLDHIYGNSALIDKDIEFIGHTELPRAMALRKEIYERLNLEYLNIPIKESIQIAPSIFIKVNESKVFDLGERKIKITAYPSAHTNNDITVEDLKTRTLWAGDLLFVDRTPVVDGDIHGIIDVTNHLISLDFNLVIPGHGTPTKNWRKAFEKHRDYFVILRDEIREAISEDIGLQEAIETVARSESRKWELFEVQNAININQVYPQLEWE